MRHAMPHAMPYIKIEDIKVLEKNNKRERNRVRVRVKRYRK